VFADGTGHEEFAVGVPGFDFDFFGHVEPGLVGDDGGLEAGLFEFLGDVLGGLAVFRRGGDVGLGSEGLEFFAGEFGVGDGEEGLFGVRFFRGEVFVAGDGGGGGRRLGGEEEEGGEEERGEEGGDARGHD
jgi:hypothetical protein